MFECVFIFPITWNFFLFIHRPFKEFCCKVIQKWWRSTVAKKKLKNLRTTRSKAQENSRHSSFDASFVHNSSIHISLEKEVKDERPIEEDAATTIQRSWRRHVVWSFEFRLLLKVSMEIDSYYE